MHEFRAIFTTVCNQHQNKHLKFDVSKKSKLFTKLFGEKKIAVLTVA
jgi:outer membrane phospholipase A